MTTPIDAEPRPRPPGDRPGTTFRFTRFAALPKEIDAPACGFFDVLGNRRSRAGGPVPIVKLGSLLWHASQLRERRFDGRFGQWESRNCPSAGGIHSIRLLVLPVDNSQAVGVYDSASHALGLTGRNPADAIALNASSVVALTDSTRGTTVQLLTNPARVAACYENYETLLWRDAGAMTATLCLVAEALGLAALPLGRHGTDVIHAFGMQDTVIGLGAVHFGGRSDPRSGPEVSAS